MPHSRARPPPSPRAPFSLHSHPARPEHGCLPTRLPCPATASLRARRPGHPGPPAPLSECDRSAALTKRSPFPDHPPTRPGLCHLSPEQSLLTLTPCPAPHLRMSHQAPACPVASGVGASAPSPWAPPVAPICPAQPVLQHAAQSQFSAVTWGLPANTAPNLSFSLAASPPHRARPPPQHAPITKTRLPTRSFSLSPPSSTRRLLLPPLGPAWQLKVTTSPRSHLLDTPQPVSIPYRDFTPESLHTQLTGTPRSSLTFLSLRPPTAQHGRRHTTNRNHSHRQTQAHPTSAPSHHAASVAGPLVSLYRPRLRLSDPTFSTSTTSRSPSTCLSTAWAPLHVLVSSILNRTIPSADRCPAHRTTVGGAGPSLPTLRLTLPTRCGSLQASFPQPAPQHPQQCPHQDSRGYHVARPDVAPTSSTAGHR